MGRMCTTSRRSTEIFVIIAPYITPDDLKIRGCNNHTTLDYATHRRNPAGSVQDSKTLNSRELVPPGHVTKEVIEYCRKRGIIITTEYVVSATPAAAPAVSAPGPAAPDAPAATPVPATPTPTAVHPAQEHAPAAEVNETRTDLLLDRARLLAQIGDIGAKREAFRAGAAAPGIGELAAELATLLRGARRPAQVSGPF